MILLKHLIIHSFIVVNNFDCILNSGARKLFQGLNHALIQRFQEKYNSSIEFKITVSQDKAESDITNFLLFDDEGKRVFADLVYRLANHTIDLENFCVTAPAMWVNSLYRDFYIKFKCNEGLTADSFQNYRSTDLYKSFYKKTVNFGDGRSMVLYSINIGSMELNAHHLC